MRGRVRLTMPSRVQNIRRSASLSEAAFMSSVLTLVAGFWNTGIRRSSGQHTSSYLRMRSPLAVTLYVVSENVILFTSDTLVLITAPLVVLTSMVPCWATAVMAAVTETAKSNIFIISLFILQVIKEGHHNFIFVVKEPTFRTYTPLPSASRLSISSPFLLSGSGTLMPSVV